MAMKCVEISSYIDDVTLGIITTFKVLNNYGRFELIYKMISSYWPSEEELKEFVADRKWEYAVDEYIVDEYIVDEGRM